MHNEYVYVVIEHDGMIEGVYRDEQLAERVAKAGYRMRVSKQLIRHVPPSWVHDMESTDG